MKTRRRLTLYTVYRNKPNDDSLVALELPAKKCCEIMGISLNHFYCLLMGKPDQGKKWTVMKCTG